MPVATEPESDPGQVSDTDVAPASNVAQALSFGDEVVKVPLALKSMNPQTFPAADAPEIGTVIE